MKLMITNGQGGKMGKSMVEQLGRQHPDLEIYTIGTNSIATSTMLRAGTNHGATGENSTIVNVEGSDIIIGPIGIAFADFLLGKITPAIAMAVEASRTFEVLIPVNRCNHSAVGREDMGFGEYIRMVCEKTDEVMKGIL